MCGELLTDHREGENAGGKEVQKGKKDADVGNDVLVIPSFRELRTRVDPKIKAG